MAMGIIGLEALLISIYAIWDFRKLTKKVIIKNEDSKKEIVRTFEKCLGELKSPEKGAQFL
jgi:hypothetical protein